jgi:hypothetical protein
MSFVFGWDPTRQVKVHQGVASLPLSSLSGKFEVAVKPDVDARQFIKDFATADGPDEFLKRLMRPWFTKHQHLVVDSDAVYSASRDDLVDANSALQ